MPIFKQKFTEFISLADDIKSGRVDLTEETSSRLRQIAEECAMVLFKLYICYCFAYEAYNVSLGNKPIFWGFLFENSTSTRNVTPRGRIGYVGGVPVVTPSPEWEDDPNNPYEFEPDWTDYLLPWNIGKSKSRLKKEKMLDKWRNYQDWKTTVKINMVHHDEIRQMYEDYRNNGFKPW